MRKGIPFTLVDEGGAVLFGSGWVCGAEKLGIPKLSDGNLPEVDEVVEIK